MWDDGTAWWHKYYPPYVRREIQAFADNMIKRMLTEPGCQLFGSTHTLHPSCFGQWVLIDPLRLSSHRTAAHAKLKNLSIHFVSFGFALPAPIRIIQNVNLA